MKNNNQVCAAMSVQSILILYCILDSPTSSSAPYVVYPDYRSYDPEYGKRLNTAYHNLIKRDKETKQLYTPTYKLDFFRSKDKG